jgi:hypothetical protein
VQAPIDFVAIPALIAAATVIGKDFRMAPKAVDTWSERPCLWGGIIAAVGEGKSPAFKGALAPVWRIEAGFRGDHEAEMEAYRGAVRLAKMIAKQWEKDCRAALKKGLEPPQPPPGIDVPPPPTPREIVTNDATQERLVGLMAANPRGIMLYRDEPLHGHGAYAKRFLPLRLGRVVAVEMKLRVVNQIDCVLAVVLLRNIDSRAMVNAQPNIEIFESEAKALAISFRTKVHVAIDAHVLFSSQ